MLSNKEKKFSIKILLVTKAKLQNLKMKLKRLLKKHIFNSILIVSLKSNEINLKQSGFQQTFQTMDYFVDICGYNNI